MPKRANKAVQELIAFGYGTFAAVIGTLMRRTQISDGVPLGLLLSLSLVLILAAGIRDRQKGNARAGFCARHRG